MRYSHSHKPQKRFCKNGHGPFPERYASGVCVACEKARRDAERLYWSEAPLLEGGALRDTDVDPS